jgi:hypothetical protein
VIPDVFISFSPTLPEKNALEIITSSYVTYSAKSLVFGLEFPAF